MIGSPVRRAALAAAVSWLCVGCESGNPPTHGPVRGKVSLGGTPVADAAVVFRNPATKEAVVTRTQADGTYAVTAHNATGLPAGRYQVAVRPANELKSDDEAMKRQVERMKQANPWAAKPATPTPIPARYHDATTSGLTAEVAAGDNPPFEFDLVPNPGK